MSGSSITPYYRGHSPLTPLEALLQRGLVPPQRRSRALSLVGLWVLAFLLDGLLMSNPWLGLVLALPAGLLYFLVYPRFSAARHTHHLQRRLARLPLLPEGLQAASLAPGSPGPGALDLVLRVHHPLMESAVRVALPDARMTWLDDHVLRIEPRWFGEQADAEALLGLLEEVLTPHTAELGLLRIRALAPAAATRTPRPSGP